MATKLPIHCSHKQPAHLLTLAVSAFVFVRHFEAKRRVKMLTPSPDVLLTFIVILMVAAPSHGRFSRSVPEVVIVRATANKNSAKLAASTNNTVKLAYQGKGAHDSSLRHHRASPGHPSKFYEEALEEELKRISQDRKDDAPLTVKFAAKIILHYIRNGSIDLQDIVKHFPSILKERPEQQLYRTLKLLRMQAFADGSEDLLYRHVNVLLKYFKGNELEPNEEEQKNSINKIDHLMEYLRYFVNSIYQTVLEGSGNSHNNNN